MLLFRALHPPNYILLAMAAFFFNRSFTWDKMLYPLSRALNAKKMEFYPNFSLGLNLGLNSLPTRLITRNYVLNLDFIDYAISWYNIQENWNAVGERQCTTALNLTNCGLEKPLLQTTARPLTPQFGGAAHHLISTANSVVEPAVVECLVMTGTQPWEARLDEEGEVEIYERGVAVWMCLPKEMAIEPGEPATTPKNTVFTHQQHLNKRSATYQFTSQSTYSSTVQLKCHGECISIRYTHPIPSHTSTFHNLTASCRIGVMEAHLLHQARVNNRDQSSRKVEKNKGS
ncbi:hypothetical protein NM208_g7459 [Fusarium decemcellulare]|uniref:Uncharacterized protein n=1 Tax=Fusarium decemcellulare TaxID=57161 RepID=A0ACC1S961_9HYPO|nr:hypothetical protein NM208_g7459 [Fusarium decemcellulare]